MTHERDEASEVADRMLALREYHPPVWAFLSEFERGHHKGAYEGLAEPIVRARKAVRALETLQAAATTAPTKWRLRGKVQGARLVLDYLLEEQHLRSEP